MSELDGNEASHSKLQTSPSLNLIEREVCFISPTHERAEGRAPVWGTEFTIQVSHYRGDSAEIASGLKRSAICVVRGAWCSHPLWGS
jgi:hypothetical protein